ncbi:hypothetical protein [Cellulomonas olei]|uniref:hypothetical protein n=1 Tax=Cellulomonas sp. P4 TaxID=3142533 RepID=UPI0031BA5011
MAGTSRGPWAAGAVVVAAGLGAAAWFGLISPTLSEAADVRDQAQSQRDQNDLLQLKVAKLESDFAKLDDYRDQLEAARAQIPQTADLSTYLRQLSDRAVTDGVTITALSPGVPVVVTLATPTDGAAAAPAATAEPSAEPSAPSEGSEAPADPDASSTPAPAAQDLGGLVAVPVSVTVVGAYPAALQYLDDLQHATQRLLLVSGVTATALEESPATASRPATAAGDVELVVTGYTYVLPDPDPLTQAGIVDEGPLPAGSGRNPLQP